MKKFAYAILARLAAMPATLWASWHEWQILKHGRSLSEQEMEICSRLGICEEVKILTVEDIPNPLRALNRSLDHCLSIRLMEPAGITLGHGIYVTREASSASLIAHELVHISQYERAGSIGKFMIEYLHQCLMYGYFDAPWEKEARSGAIEMIRRNP